MRSVLGFAVIVLVLVCVTGASARVGLGLVLGDPTGLSLKAWSGQRQAFDLVTGWSFGDDGWFYVHGDFLLHNYALEQELEEEDLEGRLPFYYGIGGRVLLAEGHESRVGVRVPLGLEYLFSDGRFDVFLEVAPIVNLAPETDLDWSAGIGARYYF